MPRVLLLATTTGYQTRAFDEAAARLGVELLYATDRCNVLDDPWRDGAVPVRFHEEERSAEAIVKEAGERRIDGVLALGDRPTVIAALVCRALGLPGNPPSAAAASRNKQLTREALSRAGMPVPWFRVISLADDIRAVAHEATYPCVIKPLALSGSRGVIRADDEDGLVAAFARLCAILARADVRSERTPASDWALVEGFIDGREFAVEGVMTRGRLRVLAVFDKPDRLDGPFFEETIYVTPSRADASTLRAIEDAIAGAARALGLWHGPIHAECRTSTEVSGPVYVLEVAARPIGGLCARSLRLVETCAVEASGCTTAQPAEASLEELLLRHAMGQDVDRWERESRASGVMMIPIPSRGMFRRVSGLEAARAVPCIDEVHITAKPDQMLVPLPEGASYLGFIFAHGSSAGEAEAALRAAHARLEFVIDPELRVVQSPHG